MANMPQGPEALGVRGHTLQGANPASLSEQPSPNTNPQVLLVSPSVSYYLEGRLAGRPTKILVDTGSALTLVRTDHWNLFNASPAELMPAQQQLVGVDGNPLRVRGTAIACISLGGKNFTVTVTIVDDMTAEAILGMDFLAAEDCAIDVGRRTLSIRSQQLQLELHSEKGQERGMSQMPVMCVTTAEVPAHSELEVVVETPQCAEGTWLLEGPIDDRLQVMTARAVVCPSERVVVARVINPNSHAVRLYKGAKLGQVEKLQEFSIVAAVSAGPSATENIASSGPSDDTLWELVTQCSGEDDRLSPTQQEQLLQVLSEHRKAFADGPQDQGRTSRVQHRIHTGDSLPVRQAPRRIPVGQREEVHKALHDMLEKKIVSPSNSPWSSPIVLVRKKDGSLRFCIDYRKLNAVTRKDAYPLPRIDETLDTLAGSRWFSTLDLLSGYWQVEIAEDDKEKTAFCVPDGLYQFNVMPFGLCNAPATFQRLMDTVLAGLHWDRCLVYLDDIIILGKTFEEHLAALSHVLGRLEQSGLKLKPSKCHLCQAQVNYLGHIVSEKGIAADPAKTTKIATWPTPSTTREVQQFMGLANYYRRFIQDFATVARPLHRLTEKGRLFQWTPDCKDAFEKLKKLLVSAPILAFPDFSKSFILDTDASATGLGAVLSQLGDDGKEHVIAYGSRTLSKSERQYCVTRRELLAVVEFLQHFRPYLLGRQFALRTDHGSLTWLRNFREPEGQMARWLERLQEYDFTITHRPGKAHSNADALSRVPCRQCGRESSVGLPVAVIQPIAGHPASELQQQQGNDPTLKLVLQAKDAGERPVAGSLQHHSVEAQRLFQLWDQLEVRDGLLYRQYMDTSGASQGPALQYVVPRAQRTEIIRQLHSVDTGGHLGIEKTIGKLRERYYWPGHWNDVELFCKTCPTCNTRKTPAPRYRAPLQSVQAGHPMQLVAMDIVGPFPESEIGNQYILVVSDYFTKWVEAYAIPNQEASTVARVLVDEFFCRFGPPRQLHSDQGRQFESKLMEGICERLEIKKSRTSPYHPQSDGQVERFNRTLLHMLSTTAKDHPWSWEDHLKKVCFAYNTSVHSTTTFTPFYLMFGRQAVLPVDLMYHPAPEGKEPAEYAAQLTYSPEEAYSRVRECTGMKQQRQKQYYDKQVHGLPHEVGTQVWLHLSALPRGSSKKLHHPWTGPYRVIKRLSDVNYRIQHTQHPRKRLVVHFDRLKPCHPSTIAGQGGTVPSIQPPEDTVHPPLPPPGTTLDIGQSETTDGAAGSQQYLPDSRGANRGDQNMGRQVPPRYPCRARHVPDRYGNFVSH